MTVRRIGILGGTFDPIHYGHLIAGEWVKEALNLDKVVFIPAGKPAHKREIAVSSGEHRMAMVREAVRENPSFSVSGMEVFREGVTYTYHTMQEFEAQYSEETEFFFIIGADTLLDVKNWYRSSDVLRKWCFVAVTRPGYRKDDVLSEKRRLEEEFQARIEIVEIPHIGISSTLIRERVEKDLSVSYLIPEGVRNYISEKGLYR